MSSHLEALLKTKGNLTRSIKEVDKEIEVEKLRLIKEKHGIKIGSIVFSLLNGDEHKITKVVNLNSWHPVDLHKPWLLAVARKKDGTFGKKIIHLYDNWTTT